MIDDFLNACGSERCPRDWRKPGMVEVWMLEGLSRQRLL